MDLVRVRQPREALLRERGLDPAAPTVALLPGSRPNELRRIVPGIAASLPLIASQVQGVQFVVAAAPNLPDALFAPRGCARSVRERTDDVLAASDVVITASGTATVQAALHERPMVVVYRLSPLTYLHWKALCARGHVRDGEPRGRPPNRARNSSRTSSRPQRVADECVRLLTNDELRQAYSTANCARVRRTASVKRVRAAVRRSRSSRPRAPRLRDRERSSQMFMIAMAKSRPASCLCPSFSARTDRIESSSRRAAVRQILQFSLGIHAAVGDATAVFLGLTAGAAFLTSHVASRLVA